MKNSSRPFWGLNRLDRIQILATTKQDTIPGKNTDVLDEWTLWTPWTRIAQLSEGHELDYWVRKAIWRSTSQATTHRKLVLVLGSSDAGWSVILEHVDS